MIHCTDNCFNCFLLFFFSPSFTVCVYYVCHGVEINVSWLDLTWLREIPVSISLAFLTKSIKEWVHGRRPRPTLLIARLLNMQELMSAICRHIITYRRTCFLSDCPLLVQFLTTINLSEHKVIIPYIYCLFRRVWDLLLSLLLLRAVWWSSEVPWSDHDSALCSDPEHEWRR